MKLKKLSMLALLITLGSSICTNAVYASSENITGHSFNVTTEQEEEVSIPKSNDTSENEEDDDEIFKQVSIPRNPLDRLTTKSIFGSDRREIVDDTTDDPYNSICYLEAEFKRSDGAIVTKLGTAWVAEHNVVVTAGHCIYDEDYGWAKSAIIIPGKDGDYEPYDTVHAYKFYVPDEYYDDQDEYYDYGVIQLKEDVDSDCKSLITASSKSFLNGDYLLKIGGYPEADGYGEYRQYEAFGDPYSYNSKIIKYKIDTDEGQSGAPVLIQKSNGKYRVVGTHVGQYSTTLNNAIRVNSDLDDIIDEYASEN